MPTQNDDAELVTPPPANDTQFSSPTSSLPTVSAAALDGKLFDGAVQPRIIQSLHGLSSPPSKPAASQLLTMQSTPDDVIKYYTWTSDQPRLYLKQSPTTTTLASLIKRANHPSRLNGNKSLESMSTQLFQARQRMPKRDAPTFAAMAALWGLEPGYLTKLTDKALCHLIVTALTHRVSSSLRSLMSPEWQLCHEWRKVQDLSVLFLLCTCLMMRLSLLALSIAWCSLPLAFLSPPHCRFHWLHVHHVG